MEFLKKYWYYSVILGLVLYILTVPKKVYKVVPKQNDKYEKVIDKLNDSIYNLNLQKNKLLLSRSAEVETVTVNLPCEPIEKIIYKNEQIIKEVNCVDFYTDYKRDSLWSGNRVTKKNSVKR